MSEQVELGDLARIPEEYRRVIARYLVQDAKRYRPSFVLSEHSAKLIAGVLTGAAVTLMTPLDEDTTIMHAADVLDDLGELTS